MESEFFFGRGILFFEFRTSFVVRILGVNSKLSFETKPLLHISYNSTLSAGQASDCPSPHADHPT